MWRKPYVKTLKDFKLKNFFFFDKLPNLELKIQFFLKMIIKIICFYFAFADFDPQCFLEEECVEGSK